MPGPQCRPRISEAGRLSARYVAYLEFVCLEIEQARKGQEKARTLRRLEILDGRIREIEAEKAPVLRRLARPVSES